MQIQRHEDGESPGGFRRLFNMNPSPTLELPPRGPIVGLGAPVQKRRSLWWDLALLAGLILAFLLVKLPADQRSGAAAALALTEEGAR